MPARRTAPSNLPDNPAKFSDPILDALGVIVAEELYRASLDRDLRILDPFAGVGKVHRLDDYGWVVGVELEYNWARQSHGMVVGNSEQLPFADGVFDLVVTSPTYGNRMADHHNAMERCRKCSGNSPSNPEDPGFCQPCGGKGFRIYKRHTYRHYHGSPLHPRNSGQMQWGRAYRLLHYRVWRECWRVVRPGGLKLVNVSNHIRQGEVVDVVEWHRNALKAVGFTLLGEETIPTKRNTHGANRHLRVDGEQILIAQR